MKICSPVLSAQLGSSHPLAAMEPATLGVLDGLERDWVIIQGAQITAGGFETRMKKHSKRADH